VLAYSILNSGYLPEYRFYIDVTSASQHLTDLILFSAKPTSGGMVTYFVTDENIQAGVAARAANPNLKLIMSVGGGGRSDNFMVVASDAGKRQKFTATLGKMVAKYELDGLDMDWESPQTEHEMSVYVRLLNEIHVSFAETGKSLSVALHPGQSLGAHGYHAVDRVHLMTYDMMGASHADFTQVKNAVNNLIDAGCPRNKLVVGLPLYAREKDNPNNVKTYAEIADAMVELEGEEPLIERMDATFRSTSEWNGFPFDSQAVAQRKTQWAKNQGLLGVFFWELGQDKNEPHVSLVEAVMQVASGSRVIQNPEIDPRAASAARPEEPVSSLRERRRAEGKRGRYNQPVAAESSSGESRRQKRKRSKESSGNYEL